MKPIISAASDQVSLPKALLARSRHNEDAAHVSLEPCIGGAVDVQREVSFLNVRVVES